jgi:hypothetical protein
LRNFAVDYRFGLVLSSLTERRRLQIKKGGSDSLSLFGPQAGRKEGVAPALLTHSTAYDLCDLGLILHCLVEGYDVTAWKTERKTVRKTDFRTVFYYSNCCEAHIGAHLAQDSLEKQYAIPETVERNP